MPSSQRSRAAWAARLPLLCLALLGAAHAAELPRTPSELYPGLFERVQLERVFEDGKTFVDAVAREDPEAILAAYERERRRADFDLRAFVTAHFELPASVGGGYRTAPGQDVREHIDALWKVLERAHDEPDPRSSLLPLPYRYIVPGGRFREIYYWDSYFTMVGLEQSGRHDLATDMVRNFAHLIDTCGHIPNGNRTYYLSRSQPPFFAAMVTLLAARDGEEVFARYLPQLEREHAFWMEGAAQLRPGTAHRRVVRLPDGAVLNRYWDDRAIPREEAWREDTETARRSGRPAAIVYRNLRAAAESGWDFSSRWFADSRNLASIRTVDVVPVDLNSLLYHLEQTLARAYRAAGRPEEAARVSARAWERREAMQRYLWNEGEGFFTDYLWRERRVSPHLTAATLYPLFFGVATPDQAADVAAVVRSRLLQPDGIATTLIETGEQWDAPNGWAPLQWIAIRGLRDTGHAALAADIARRWIRENLAVYRATGRLVEKYDITGEAAARGGEYPTQDGFGWTNGVLRRLLALYPEEAARPLPAPAAARAGVLSSAPSRVPALPDPHAVPARLAGAFSVPTREAAACPAGARLARDRNRCALGAPR